MVDFVEVVFGIFDGVDVGVFCCVEDCFVFDWDVGMFWDVV